MRQTEVRLQEERRIGAVDLQAETDVADVGNERGGADGVAEHLCNPLDEMVTFNHYMVVTVTCQHLLLVLGKQ
jgi:hypothetical protein